MKKGKGFARRVTLRNIHEFKPLLTSVAAPRELFRQRTSVTSSARTAVESLFKGSHVAVPGFERQLKRHREETTATEVAETQLPELEWEMVWEKTKLPRSDAQLTRQGTNPTGNLRLSQANFRLSNGSLINSRTYFRFEIFGSVDWRGVKGREGEEEAFARVRVRILGKDYGEKVLRVSYNPTREAEQGNVRTVLHWGDLTREVRAAGVGGKSLRLWRALDHLGNRFLLEII